MEKYGAELWYLCAPWLTISTSVIASSALRKGMRRSKDSLQTTRSLTASKDQFDDYRESTIGAAFLTQTIALDEATTVKFEIWDTAGQERYKSLAPMYYRNANCAVVVYDITQAVGRTRRDMHFS